MMKLSKENIEKWKNELDEKAKPYFGEKFSASLSDKEWLDGHEGETPQECVMENVSASM